MGGGRGRNINRTQIEAEGHLIVKFDSVGKLETLFDIPEVEPNKTTNVIMMSHLNCADQV